MTTSAGLWHLGIGDPTVVGWVTVAAYAIATVCCWRVRAVSARPRFWFWLTITMGLLGLNKQLDLQTALTDIGRAMALDEGWYHTRHRVQIGFIALVSVGGVIALAALAHASRPLSSARALALGGAVFLMVFVLTRASSFHHVDFLLSRTAFGLRWNWILELSGIGLVAWAARLEGRAATHRSPSLGRQ